MVYHNQNPFSLDGQNVRENCDITILLEQNFNQYIETSLKNKFLSIEWTFYEFSYKCFPQICINVCREPYKFVVIDRSKMKNTTGKLLNNLDKKVL